MEFQLHSNMKQFQMQGAVGEVGLVADMAEDKIDLEIGWLFQLLPLFV